MHDLDSGLVRAVGLTAANAPEASVTEDISEDIMLQGIELQELHTDRAYLSSELVRHCREGLEIYCKAWLIRQDKLFSKQEFHLDWDRQIIRCPAEQEMPFTPGGAVHFSQEHCVIYPLHTQYTKSLKVRSMSIHPEESFLADLRQHQLMPVGRAKLRANASRWSIHWLISVQGSDDVHSTRNTQKPL